MPGNKKLNPNHRTLLIYRDSNGRTRNYHADDGHDQDWLEKFSLLIDFRDEHGNVNVPHKHSLGSWVADQRKYYKHNRLSSDRIQALSNVGFIWNMLEHSWNQHFQAVQDFKNRFNKFPSQTQSHNGLKIGKWFHNQRTAIKGMLDSDETQSANKRKAITPEQYKKLIDLGIVLNVNDDKWDRNFELVKEYKLRKGTFPSRYTVYRGENIGFWCGNQRQANLKPSEKDRLSSIGFPFKIGVGKGVRTTTSYMDDAKWEQRFKQLKSYFTLHSNTKGLYTENAQLHKWLHDQKTVLSLSNIAKQQDKAVSALLTSRRNKFITIRIQPKDNEPSVAARGR